MNVLRVEYEIPPLRAIYFAEFHDDGQEDSEILEHFRQQRPARVVRKICRVCQSEDEL